MQTNGSIPAATVGSVSARERKRAQKLAEVQSHALRIIQQQGYANTSTADIFKAAGISSATFFRYFATKEDVVLFDATDMIMVDSSEPPAELSPIQAVKWLVNSTFNQLTNIEKDKHTMRLELIRTEPKLRARFADEVIRHVSLLATVIEKHTGKSAESAWTQTLAISISGIILTALLRNESPGDYIDNLNVYLDQLEDLMTTGITR